MEKSPSDGQRSLSHFVWRTVKAGQGVDFFMLSPHISTFGLLF